MAPAYLHRSATRCREAGARKRPATKNGSSSPRLLNPYVHRTANKSPLASKTITIDQASYDLLQKARSAVERGKTTEAVEDFQRAVASPEWLLSACESRIELCVAHVSNDMTKHARTCCKFRSATALVIRLVTFTSRVCTSAMVTQTRRSRIRTSRSDQHSSFCWT